MTSKKLVSALLLAGATIIVTNAGCSSADTEPSAAPTAERLSTVQFGEWVPEPTTAASWTAPATVNEAGRSTTMLTSITSTSDAQTFELKHKDRSFSISTDHEDPSRVTLALSGAMSSSSSPRALITFRLDDTDWQARLGSWLKENNDQLPPGGFVEILAHASEGVSSLRTQGSRGGIAPRGAGWLAGFVVVVGVVVAIVEIVDLTCPRVTQLQCQNNPYGGEWCRGESFRSCLSVPPQAVRCVGGSEGSQCRPPPPDSEMVDAP